jgi:DNA-binding CsgD family transcriptional regulator/class 3 adenylate cyclase
MDDVRAVLDAVGSTTAVVMGVSEGGALCTLFAATYPERTLALVLVGCVPRRIKSPDYPWGASAEERAAQLATMEAEWASPDWVTRDLERRAPSVAHDEHFARWWATYVRMSASPGAALAVARMNNQLDIRPLLPAVRVPTLIVHRLGDRTAPIEAARYVGAHIPNARLVELAGLDHLPFVGDQDAVLDPIEEFLTGIRPTVHADRVLATVLAMEVTNAPAVIARIGAAAWRSVERSHADLIDAEVRRWRGQLAGAAGGGVLITFDGPARGIRCAQAIVAASRSLGLNVRAALHTGECDLIDGQLGGTAFRIATWAMTLAQTDDVLVSSTVRDLVAGSGIEFEEHIEQPAPDGLGTWRLSRAGRAGEASAPPAPPAAPAAPRGPGRNTSSLTAREREVAVLVARGLTNREIADALVISAATAERHVINIFNKLGFRSRSQVAAWAVEQKIHAPVQDS